MAEGLLNMLKPPGITSHDLVDEVRRTVGMRRVGHTGTLDPAAAGVVMVMLGTTTRLSEWLTSATKVYRAEITFGVRTDTLDSEGQVLSREDASQVTADQVEAGLSALTGEMQIVPPMYSAVHFDGERLYEIARRGEQADVKPRPMTVMRFELLHFTPGPEATALTEIECAKGTYVRSLAELLGEHVGCGAHLSLLVRTRVGSHAIADAYTPAELAGLAVAGSLPEAVIPPSAALPECAQLTASPEVALMLTSGAAPPLWEEIAEGQFVSVLTPDGRLLGMCEIVRTADGLVVQPRRILIGSDDL